MAKGRGFEEPRVGPPVAPRAGRSRLGEIARVFLRLGVVGFGGPAAHVALMRHELVGRRAWLSDQEFLDLLGAVNLIPGPNSTELAIHLGYRRGGWRGLLLAGLCFIVPAFVIVLACAWLYVAYGSVPEARGVLAGMTPVIVVIIASAGLSLGRTAVKGPLTAVIVVGAFGASLAGAPELGVLAAGLLAGLFPVLRRLLVRDPGTPGSASRLSLLMPASWLSGFGGLVGVPLVGSATVLGLFLVFLKIGAVLYGSGYVLIAFLRSDLVVGLGWLSERQLLDAIAVGQITPGPLFTTATFVGYVLLGVPGAIVATAAIFLPAFIFVAASVRVLPRLVASSIARALLDGVNAAALGLLAAVAIVIAGEAIRDLLSASIAILAAVLLARRIAGPSILVLLGGLAGLARVLAGA